MGKEATVVVKRLAGDLATKRNENYSACGGMGKEATVVVKRLAGDLATKRNENYSQIVGWMRCSLAFSLARSAIRCVRGSRSTRRRDIRQSPMDLIHAETRFECK